MASLTMCGRGRPHHVVPTTFLPAYTLEYCPELLILQDSFYILTQILLNFGLKNMNFAYERRAK